MKVLQISKDNGPVQRELFLNEKKMGISTTTFTYTLSADAKSNTQEAIVYRYPFLIRGPFFIFARIKMVSLHLQNKVDISGYDLVHAHFLSMDGKLANDIKKRHGIPYVVSVRNTDLNMPGLWSFPWNKHVLVSILEEADAVFFLSKSYRDKLLGKLSFDLSEKILKKSYIIPNGINEFWLENIYRRPQMNLSKKVRLLTVGDIVKNKNQLSVSKAVNILKRKGFDVSYTVVGKCLDKKIWDSLERDGVILLEYCDKRTLCDIYRNHDIMVMPSFRESFGLVYAEAITQGLPVIYSVNEGFYSQFEEGKVGYGVDPYSTEDIVDKILKIMNEYNRIVDSLNECSRCFSWDDITRKVIDVYKKISLTEE